MSLTIFLRILKFLLDSAEINSQLFVLSHKLLILQFELFELLHDFFHLGLIFACLLFEDCLLSIWTKLAFYFLTFLVFSSEEFSVSWIFDIDLLHILLVNVTLVLQIHFILLNGLFVLPWSKFRNLFLKICQLIPQSFNNFLLRDSNRWTNTLLIWLLLALAMSFVHLSTAVSWEELSWFPHPLLFLLLHSIY